MANKNEIVKLTDGVYQIKYYWLGIANVYAYLIVGSERALLIDTCYSITGIKKYVEQITTLPVDVVNTHGHFDHVLAMNKVREHYGIKNLRQFIFQRQTERLLENIQTIMLCVK